MLAFTTGMDPVFDLELAPYDVMGSMAHGIMLTEVGLLSREEGRRLMAELKGIFQMAEEGDISLDEGVEDIHSQVEMMLTASLGDLGKRIHTGRSRNDQVMVDIKLFLREELEGIIRLSHELGSLLLEKAEANKGVLIPGYTHMQVAMPSSFGLWFGAYAEALADDLSYIQGIYRVLNQNPLGSAAGFGSSFPVDRELTTRLLGFESMHVGSVNAQLNRGKSEWYMASGMAAVASTLGRLAMDAVLFMGQNFQFMSLPAELTTGSSIMPHKKNPDVLELIRARCNRLGQVPSSVSAVCSNLISGYHRDFQLLKEILHPAIAELRSCLQMMQQVIKALKVNEDILNDEIYAYLFSVEEVNKKVQEGIPFRDAYKEVANDIDKGRYRPGRDHSYTHLGSIGNPGIAEVQTKLDQALAGYPFVKPREIIEAMSSYFDKS